MEQQEIRPQKRGADSSSGARTPGSEFLWRAGVTVHGDTSSQNGADVFRHHCVRSQQVVAEGVWSMRASGR